MFENRNTVMIYNTTSKFSSFSRWGKEMPCLKTRLPDIHYTLEVYFLLVSLEHSVQSLRPSQARIQGRILK